MTNPWRDTAFAFGALPEVGALLLSPVPAWVWSRDGSRVLWANPAGAAILGASKLKALSERRWSEAHQLRRAIASLARALPEQGMLARLRLAEDLHSMPVACRCRILRVGEERAVLIVALEAAGVAPSLAALASYLADPDSDVAIFDASGAVLAESRRGAAAEIRPSAPHIEFSDAGRALRVAVLERTPDPTGEAEAIPPQPLRDDAGLIIRQPPIVEEPAPAIIEEPPPVIDEPPPASPRREIPTIVVQRPPEVVRAPPSREPEPDPEMLPARRPVRQAAAPSLKRAVNGEAAAVEMRPTAPKPSATEKPAPAERPPARSVMAGRVAQELSRKPVRFLWQTDASDRFLFVSPGLVQVVGRNADIVGERWGEAAARLNLDPGARILQALRQRDTWSGLTAWWPIEGSNVRVPVELTALPVFGGDQSFQGYRGFGILRPAEALMPAAFEARFGSAGSLPEQQPPYEESTSTAPVNVVPIRSDIERIADHTLTPQERNAFDEIAAALRDRVAAPSADPATAPPPPAPPGLPSAERVLEELQAGRRAREHAREASERQADDEARTPPPSEPVATEPEEALPDAAPAPASAAPTPAAPPGEAQRRLREMTAILDTATDGVVILDAEGVIESVNGSAEALFGLDAHEMQGRPFAELLTPASRKSALDYLSGLKDSGVASLLNEGREVEALAGAGSIPLFMTMGRISSDAGGRYCAVLRDITHWKRIESELLGAKLAAERASSQKSEFLARVSHEIRTPLNAIIGFAEVMSEERYGPIANERYREYLRDIRTSGEHVVSLVNDLLDIAKIEAGKLDLTFGSVALNEVVRESIDLMQPQANRARVVLRSSLSREVPNIVADERTLRQIVLNLLSNSVKFTGPGGQVIASTSLSEKGEALLRVRDTGEGMSEDELARALEPFRQLSTAAMSGPAGTGLGLPLTKALVEANRASLSIKSARGEGTVVTVTIPPTRVLSE